MDRTAFTREQREAIDAIASGKDVYLAGESAAGKTTVLRHSIESLPKDRRVIIAAPTAVAAAAVGGTTLHRAFGLPTRPLVNLSEREPLGECALDADIVFIDEVGGMRRDTADLVAGIVDRASSARREQGRPPVQVVVGGSFSALPPVATDRDRSVLRDFYGEGSGYYAFESRSLWDRFEAHVLGTRFDACGDAEFCALLDRLREGDRGCAARFDRMVDGRWPSDAVKIVQTNKACDAANRKRLSALRGRGKVYEATCTGCVTRSDMVAQDSLELKEGARVITLADGEGFVRGQLGTVVGLGDGSVKVKLDGLRDPVDIGRHSWTARRGAMGDGVVGAGIAIGCYEQIPLRLAYALTAHGAQGQLFDEVVVDPAPPRGRAAVPGMLYAMVSRCRTSAGLHLARPVDECWIVADPRVVEHRAAVGIGPQTAVGTAAKAADGPAAKRDLGTGADTRGGTKNPGSMTIEEIQGELHEILRIKPKWGRVFELIDHVERTAAYLEAGYRNFSSWVNAQAALEGVSPSLFWHRRSAGRFYSEWAKEHPSSPGLGELPQINEGNLNLVRKIGKADEGLGRRLMADLVEGRVAARDLRRTWKAVSKRDSPENAKRLVAINGLAGRGAVSVDGDSLTISLGGDGRLLEAVLEAVERHLSTGTAEGGTL